MLAFALHGVIYESQSISEIKGVEESLALFKEEFEDHVKKIEDI
jgi:hypothetical protein